jgi:integrase
MEEISQNPDLSSGATLPKSSGMTTARIPIGEAISKLLIAKKAANRRERYIKELGFFLRMFARGREDWTLDKFDLETVEAWLAERNYAPSSMASSVGKLSSLFVFAVKRGWQQCNPCDRLEKISIERKPVRILSVEESEKLLRWCEREKPQALAYLVTCLMGCVRPEEACLIDWNCIPDFCDWIRIDASVSKVRQRRIIALEPAAALWLERARELKSRLPASFWSRRYWVNEFRDVLGLEHWDQDLLRHTNASYLLALKEDATHVSHMMGNSPPTLHRHYKAICSREDAKRFWSILP